MDPSNNEKDHHRHGPHQHQIVLNQQLHLQQQQQQHQQQQQAISYGMLMQQPSSSSSHAPGGSFIGKEGGAYDLGELDQALFLYLDQDPASSVNEQRRNILLLHHQHHHLLTLFIIILVIPLFVRQPTIIRYREREGTENNRDIWRAVHENLHAIKRNMTKLPPSPLQEEPS